LILVKPDNVYYVHLGVLDADWAGCAYEEEGIGFGESTWIPLRSIHATLAYVVRLFDNLQ
jgi:hypothetical protein